VVIKKGGVVPRPILLGLSSGPSHEALFSKPLSLSSKLPRRFRCTISPTDEPDPTYPILSILTDMDPAPSI